MFQKMFSFAGTLLLAGMVLLIIPGTGQARGGGGHSGGAHYGGYRGGMYHGGGRYGGYHYGYGRYYGGSYPYRGLYGGYYPYADGTANLMYDSGPYGEVTPDSEFSTSSPSTAGAYRAFYAPPTATVEPNMAAHVTVKAPAGAQLWFNGIRTDATGAVRQFNSPPLPAGKYIYDVQARWIENGHSVTETRQVEVARGSRVEVDFPGAAPQP